MSQDNYSHKIIECSQALHRHRKLVVVRIHRRHRREGPRQDLVVGRITSAGSCSNLDQEIEVVSGRNRGASARPSSKDSRRIDSRQVSLIDSEGQVRVQVDRLRKSKCVSCYQD